MFKELFEAQSEKWKGGSDESIKGLVQAYDFYTDYIDSNVQKKKKDDLNKQIKSKLKKLGVTEIQSGDVKVKI